MFVRLPPKKKGLSALTFRELSQKLDLLGTVIFMPCIVCLLLALEWGGVTYAWNSWRIILCICLFAVLILIWVYIQYTKGDNATLPLRILKQRSVASSMLFMFGAAGGMFVIVYYVPIWFQSVKDTTAEQSGINYLAATGAMSFTAILSGALVSRCDAVLSLLLLQLFRN